MAPTFSTPTKVVTITANVRTGNARYGAVTDADIRRETEAVLRELARQYDLTVDMFDVSVADGPRTVTMTEDEFNTLRQGGAPAQ